MLEMLFLLLNNVDVQFDIKNLTWRIYTTVKALSITNWVEHIDKITFAKVIPDTNLETFVVYVLAF